MPPSSAGANALSMRNLQKMFETILRLLYHWLDAARPQTAENRDPYAAIRV